ncbi:phosphatidylinositol-glycan biosynthesis class S protein [Cercophora scortea]|uniref:Phosphatidylinositol-glycan biosynthesis class S protein n=1 Tax=Cercophora scortea TaxID=314031 RepID=A0AAE0I8A9_9PEZI|nr:phosphatidylinositol-glycan biosynthesis class S protein [Cercophora scortea]
MSARPPIDNDTAADSSTVPTVTQDEDAVIFDATTTAAATVTGTGGGTETRDSPAKKQPPPEEASDVRRRTWVILSFWLVVVCLGLPIWWKTTTIYRANLPLDEMLEWADGKACRPVFPLRIAIQADSLHEQEAQNLLRLTQHALDDLNDFSGHHLRLQLSPPPANDDDKPNQNGDDTALTIRLVPGEATTATLDPYAPILDITYPPNTIPSATSSSSSLAAYVANQLRSTFAEEQAIISYLLSTNSMPSEHRPQGLTPEAAESLSKRTTRSLKYAPTYHLTFSLLTSGPLPSSWDIEAAIDEYMKPVLDVLSPIHNFTIDTQVQLYATPGVQNQVLNKEDLSSFVNAAEWPLSPSIGGAPTVNFILFIGNQTIGNPAELAESHNPDNESTASPSWLIPQWGTVYLLSLPHDTTHVSVSTLKQPLLTFTSHLLSLTGTPQSGSLPLRLSTLSRIRSADLLLRASSTLGSLARLSLALPSISIPSSVADGVSKTMAHLRLACETLGGAEGLEHARIAEAEAERAFFEKSMVGQLYFPDEHKIAVYLPLLGPVGVPLVMGLLNEIKAWRKRRRDRAEKAAAKKKE